MKITCNIIRDLMPAYVDGTLSEDSRALVDEHLGECEECREYLAELQLPAAEKSAGTKEKAAFLKAVRRKLLRRNVVIVIVTIVCLVGGVVGLSAYDCYHPSYMTAARAGLTVRSDDGQIGLYSKKPYGTANYYEKDGVLFVYCTNTVTNRVLSSFDSGKSSGMMWSLDDIKAVYYVSESMADRMMKNDADPARYKLDLDGMSLGDLIGQSKLIWKK
jgi:hypothetical protein